MEPCGNHCLIGMPGVQDADREALRNMEDTAKEVSERVSQLAADREELAQAATKTRADLAAAQESLTAKKAALEKAMDANRRNGCIATACSTHDSLRHEQSTLTKLAFLEIDILCTPRARQGAPHA